MRWNIFFSFEAKNNFNNYRASINSGNIKERLMQNLKHIKLNNSEVKNVHRQKISEAGLNRLESL